MIKMMNERPNQYYLRSFYSSDSKESHAIKIVLRQGVMMNIGRNIHKKRLFALGSH